MQVYVFFSNFMWPILLKDVRQHIEDECKNRYRVVCNTVDEKGYMNSIAKTTFGLNYLEVRIYRRMRKIFKSIGSW